MSRRRDPFAQGAFQKDLLDLLFSSSLSQGKWRKRGRGSSKTIQVWKIITWGTREQTLRVIWNGITRVRRALGRADRYPDSAQPKQDRIYRHSGPIDAWLVPYPNSTKKSQDSAQRRPVYWGSLAKAAGKPVVLEDSRKCAPWEHSSSLVIPRGGPPLGPRPAQGRSRWAPDAADRGKGGEWLPTVAPSDWRERRPAATPSQKDAVEKRRTLAVWNRRWAVRRRVKTAELRNETMRICQLGRREFCNEEEWRDGRVHRVNFSERTLSRQANRICFSSR